MPPGASHPGRLAELHRLIQVVDRLRSPGGCPWDRKQTHASLKPHLIEETYEVIDAIDSGDPEKIKEELGDLLCQVVMHSRFAQERKKGRFDILDVAHGIADKLVRRHPHVFAGKKVKNAEELLSRWEEIKKQEKRAKGRVDESVLSGIPKGLPALARAQEIQARAARVGFDWDQVAGAWEKVFEELAEVHDLLKPSRKNPLRRKGARLKEEIGDLLFAITNVCRKMDIKAEEALQESSQKFVCRFEGMEKISRARGKELSSHKPGELDAMWERVKKASKGS